MEATLKTSDLRNAVAYVSRGSSSRTSISILQCIHLAVVAGGLTLTAHDGEVQLSMDVPATDTTEGAVLIRGKELNDLLRVAKADVISVSAIIGDRVYYDDAECSWAKRIPVKYTDEECIVRDRVTEYYKDPLVGVKVVCGNLTRKFQTVDVEDFPLWPNQPVEGPPARIISASDFARIMLSVTIAVSPDTHRQALTGVLLVGDKAVATDTHRLAVLTIDAYDSSVIVPERVWDHLAKSLPKKFAGEIKLYLSGATRIVTTWNDGGDVKTESTEPIGQYIFTYDGGPVIVFDPIKGQYPNYERVIPSETTRTWQVDACELLEACQVVKTVACEAANRIRFRDTDAGFVVSARSEETGEIEMAVAADGKNTAGFEIAVNVKYMLDAIKGCWSERLELRMTAYSRPAIVASPGDDAYIYVIMPMALA